MRPTPCKLAVTPTKPLATKRDLSLAYSPGVAFASDEIVRDNAAARLTARANLVGVVTNGSAVLGLGNIGPLASKPVMEGKAVHFKKFAGIDVSTSKSPPRTRIGLSMPSQRLSRPSVRRSVSRSSLSSGTPGLVGERPTNRQFGSARSPLRANIV
jgi:hypothetical protein